MTVICCILAILVLMVPRFGITQGEKVRAVDHFSWSHAPKCRKRKRAEMAGAAREYQPDTIARDA